MSKEKWQAVECLVAAILATGGMQAGDNPTSAFNRYREALQMLRTKGGASQDDITGS